MSQINFRVVLFGTGAISKLLSNSIKENVKIVAYINDYNQGEIDGIPVISLQDVSTIDFDYVVVAFGDSIKGIELLKKQGVPDEKIVGYSYSGLSYECNVLQNDSDFNADSKLKNILVSQLFNLEKQKYYLCGMNSPINADIIERDFVREQTLSFLAEEIYRKGIEGSVAEIGVADGNFAKKINRLFPDRKLYLFDTYEGLSQRDKDKAIAMGWGESQYALAMQCISEDKVLLRMPYSEKCVIKKGHFPDTFDIDDRFAFISLDIDFYESTKNGLELIYPFLEKGGYIMVHDYHNLTFCESRNAVIDFCDNYRISYVPIPDNGGSVVITK